MSLSFSPNPISRICILVAAVCVFGSISNSTAEMIATILKTHREQAAAMASLTQADRGISPWAKSTSEFVTNRYIQRDYSIDYERATPSERRTISERVGNQASARYAAERNWRRLLGSQGRNIPQGPDSLYWDPKTGRLRAVERKGGASKAKTSYFAKQGTNQYHIRSAMAVLRSKKTSMKERLATARIIKSAQYGRLESTLIRGGARGMVAEPRVEGGWDRASVRREAMEIERRLVRRDPQLREVFRSAASVERADMLRYRIGQGVGVLGLVGAGALWWDAYRQSNVAWQMFHDPMLSGGALPYLQSGLATGRASEASALGLGSASRLNWLGSGRFQVFGQAAGKWFLPIAIGTETLGAGISYYEYSNGRLGERDFYRRMTGTGIFVACTAGGAGIGVWFGGIGAVPGALIGSVVGGIGQVGTNFYWSSIDRGFNADQLRAINLAIDLQYGIDQ